VYAGNLGDTRSTSLCVGVTSLTLQAHNNVSKKIKTTLLIINLREVN